MRHPFLMAFCCFAFFCSSAQTKWINVDSLYQPLPKSVHVFYTTNGSDSLPFKAYYVVADLKSKELHFTTDTTNNRRLTPDEFYAKNGRPLLVVNGTFFSFETNRNLNVVIKEGKVVSFNSKTVKSRADSNIKLPIYSGAIGLNKKGSADVAWIKTDSTARFAQAVQYPFSALSENNNPPDRSGESGFKKWKMRTAIGGGPVLVQKGQIKITNDEERMFAGKAIKDKHPRTAMGYTADNKLILLVVEGRNPAASGATLGQEAALLQELGCVEALNLDGGGSSCLLINGKETIVPSDKKQRAVPAVFIIQKREN